MYQLNIPCDIEIVYLNDGKDSIDRRMVAPKVILQIFEDSRADHYVRLELCVEKGL